MKTTLNKIRDHSPCKDGWKKLLKHLGKTQANDEPLSISTILDSNGLSDALWCLRTVEGYDRELRLFAIRCARRVQPLMTDPRSIAALDVAERFANGQDSARELYAARAAARAAAWEASEAAWEAERAAARAAARDARAAGAAARAAARAAAWEAAEAAWDAAQAAAWDAGNDAQEADLRQICEELSHD